MSDEWKRYIEILEWEDKEFRKAMEAEVSPLFCPRLNSKCRNFGRDRHYCPPSNEFYNFQVMPSSSSMMSVKFMNFHLLLGFGS